MKNLKRILSFFIVMGFMFVMFGFRVAAVATSKTVTYTVTSTTTVSESGYGNGTSATYTQTYGTACQATSGKSFTLTVTFDYDSTITGLVLSMKSNSKGGAGSLSATISGSKTATVASIADSKFNTASWNGAWSTSYVDVTPTVTSTAVEAGDTLTIVIAATANSLYCESYTITYSADIPSNPSVSISIPANINLMVGNTLQLESSYFDIDNPTSDVWNSSNTNAATVSSTGLVTPVAMGNTNIKRTVDGTESNAIALRIWPSNTSNISVATALAIAEFSGDEKTIFEYTCEGTVAAVNGDSFTLSDGNDSIAVYRENHGLSVNDPVIVHGSLRYYKSQTLRFQSPTLGYVVSFDSNGGSPSYDSLTDIAKGSNISNPGSPTKEGYEFNGWYNGENEWNFDTDTVTTSMTLTAHWGESGLDASINTQISTISAYMSMAYTYTFGSAPTSNTYIKATGVSQLSAGDTVIIVSKANDGNYYAVTNSINDKKMAARSSALTIENNVITSEISSEFVWTLSGNAKDGWALKNGEKYIDNGSNADMALGDSEAKEFMFVSSGNNSYFLNNGTRAIFDNGTGFKNYAISNIGKNDYATEVYVFVKQASVNNTYRDVDFRLRIAVDGGVDAVLSSLSLEGKWGIEVTAGDTTVRYDCDGAYMQTISGKKYVVVDLGDMLNDHYDKLTTNFTARAYVLYNGNYYYSTNTKTHSVKTLLDNYYSSQETSSIVEGLVQALEGYGYLFSNE